MTDRELMQQALDALVLIDGDIEWREPSPTRKVVGKAITVLRERLAQPEQDAVLAQREACAALVDCNAMGCDNPIYRSLLQANAAAIRAMEKT